MYCLYLFIFKNICISELYACQKYMRIRNIYGCRKYMHIRNIYACQKYMYVFSET